jgi:hypothetical protein
MRTLLLLMLAVVPAASDSLDGILERAGFSRADLGWTPAGWWQRYPRAVPHKLDHFDDLFAEPLAIVPFTRTMGRATEDLLGRDGLAKKAERGAHSLYRLVYELGVDRKVGGFRPYTPNLTAPPTPLDEAILQLYRYAGRKTRFVTFGDESPYPLVEKELEAAAAKLPPEVSRVLGQLVLNVVDAHRWATLAFRNVSLEQRVRVARRLDLGMESVDALEYEPACDDVARTWDEASLWYAGLKCVEALDTARRALPAGVTGQFAWETPLGWIRVLGTGGDTTDCEDALLVVDLGGDDYYTGPIAAGTPTRPIGLVLDLAGDDRYNGKAQGCGRCGIGVLLDAAGNDQYEAEQSAQGMGQFGLGVLADLDGEDFYRARWSAQGCGYFGIGLLLDAAGKDDYHLHADGQGFGGVAGVGVLADRSGNDRYVAEPDAAKSGRPSYHSKLKVSVSNVQGCAMGRRGDGADGHSWAGGLGALIDVEGDDAYVAGNWAQGTGYWFGTGLLWDGAGNDSYSGHVWAQATGAHFCIGALLDEAGDDRYGALERNSICFGHDFTIALLFDAAGNDRYETPEHGIGYSINRSFAILIDAAGNDFYRAKNAPGFARYDKRLLPGESLSPYWAITDSAGLFLDLDGKDDYGEIDRNGTQWGDARDSDNGKVCNMSVGADLEKGVVDWTPRRR